MNLTLIKGLDGMAILSELLGVEEVIETTKNIIFSRKKKNELRSHVMAGQAAVLACYMLGAFQIALPLLMILNILEVVLCFV